MLDIFSIPIQASTVGEDRGIHFDLNNMAVIIAKVFIARKNMRFIMKYCDTDKVLMAGRLYPMQGNENDGSKKLVIYKRNR